MIVFESLRSLVFRSQLVWVVALLCVGSAIPVRATSTPSAEQELAEAGAPPMQVFLPADYEGHEQVWAAVADARGLMHFGNYRAVLYYDGANWQNIPIGNTTYVRSLTLAPDRRIYVAGVDELGYLEENKFGQKHFVSLLEKLPPEHRELGAVWNVLANAHGVYFAAGPRLLRWHDGRFEVWKDSSATAFQRIALEGETLYHHTAGQPLERMSGDARSIVTADPRIVKTELMSMLAGENGALLYVSATEGFFQIGPDGSVAPWPTDADSLFHEDGIFQAKRLPDRSILVATRNAGLVHLDAHGRFLRRIGPMEGLPNRTARIGVGDATGAIWIPTNNGIVRAWLSEGRTVFRASQELDGGLVSAVVRHHGQLHVATTSGVSRLVPANRLTLTNAHLEPVPGLASPAFSLVSTPHGLIVGENFRLAALADGSSKPVQLLDGPTVLDLAVSKAEPGVIWGARGSGGGLVRIAWQNDHWQAEGPYDGVDGNLHKIIEDARGDLWGATAMRGVRRIELKASKAGAPRRVDRVTLFGRSSPFPDKFGTVSLRLRSGEVLFLLANQLWRYNSALGRPELEPKRNEDSAESVNLRVEDYTPTLVEGTIAWRSERTQLHRVHLDRMPVNAAPDALITSVELLDGTSWPDENKLPAGRHDVVFRFTSQLTRQSARLQTQLRGYDPEWSQPGSARTRVYTNLPPGDYTFAVRAADGDGAMGAETTFSFSILIPWWRTMLAQSAGIMLFLGGVFGVVRWRHLALRRRNAELAALVSARTAELREARDASEAANRAKSTFLANMSHELRTPLNGILGYAQILRRDASLPETQRAQAGVIAASGEHLLGLINEVLDLAKVEAGYLTMHESVCDVRELIESVANLMRPRAAAKGLNFTVTIDSMLPAAVSTDKQKLRQILLNLLSNAVKFTERGSVTLQVSRHAENRTVFEITDTGVGVAPEQLSQLFQRFSSSEDATAQGTGLGLALSQRFAELLHGRITVNSVPGRGSQFTLELPLPATTPLPVLPGADSVTGYEGPRRRVLIVDDDATNRAVLRELLESVGFTVEVAVDGNEAIARCENTPPDLVLLDLRFTHGPDGRQIARQFRVSPRLKRVRIIAVSASVFASDRDEAIRAGCDEFLSKPFTEAQLWTVVGDMLELVWKRTLRARSTDPVDSPPLPAEAVQELRDYAAQGDVAGLRASLAQWSQRLPDQRKFLERLEALAATYNLDHVETLLTKPNFSAP